MTDRAAECAELATTHALADGELAGADAEAARAHLATCATCQAELADIMQLVALADGVGRVPAPQPAPAPIASLAWYRQRRVQLAGAAIAAAAGVAIYLAWPRGDAREVGGDATLIALAPQRALEARLSWGAARDYRAYDVPRAGTPAREPIALATLAAVERTGDTHGVGVLALIDGDRARAASYLARAGDTADVLADRAALALADGQPERALALADDALREVTDHAAAMWNRALALRELGLTASAAAAFTAVAARGERGWSAEASQRAAALDADTEALYALSLRVAAAAAPLAATGAGLAIDDARALPGMARIELYDALRAAPDAARIAQLQPLAVAIDAVDHTADATATVARAVPIAALAAGYADVLAGRPPDRARYLAALRAAHADDLLIGALLKLSPDGRHVAAGDLVEYAKLTAASPDPWMQLLGLEQRAAERLIAGDLPGAETILLAAQPPCAAGAPSFRCLKLAMQRGELYLRWGRLSEARTALAEAWRRARAGAQWEAQEALLAPLANLAALADDNVGGGLPLARAYTAEARERAAREQRHGNRQAGSAYDACQPAVWGRNLVAMILVNQLRFDDAARELAAAPPCDVPIADPTAAALGLYTRAEVVRATGTPAEVVALRAQIAKLRASPSIAAGDRAFLALAEGRVIIDRDPVAGAALLRDAIAIGKAAPPTDANAHSAAAFSSSVLAVAAGVRGDGAQALAVIADELGVAVPARCALGLAIEDATAITIVRGPTGALIASHQTRTSPAIDGATLVPADAIAALAGCEVVDVLARQPIHGASRLLPDAIAWRYVSPRAHPVRPPDDRELIVADVEPPAALELPRLGAWSAPRGATLSGAAATPAHVLAAIGDAGEVVIHSHGIVDQAEASYLALSPDADGHYALTAAEVGAATFRTSPLVVLAACSAAQAAPVLRARWSLPVAFIRAGARAVVASTAAMPDAEAGAFFDELRARVHAGATVAIALRDVRVAWLARHPAPAPDWVRDIVVFE